MQRIQKVMAMTLVLVSTMGSQSEAGLDTTTGNEWHLWTEGRYSVIVARVSNISEMKLDEGHGTHRATLEPLCVLAGSLDPSEHPALHVTFYANAMTSSISSPPKNGSIVLSVLMGADFVVSDICTFMPKESALVEINGLADPRVIETLKKIQNARAHPGRNPYDPGTTRPTENATKPR